MYNGQETYAQHSCPLQQAPQVLQLPRPRDWNVQDALVQADQGDGQEEVLLPQESQRAPLNLGQVQQVQFEQGVVVIDGAINHGRKTGGFRQRLQIAPHMKFILDGV